MSEAFQTTIIHLENLLDAYTHSFVSMNRQKNRWSQYLYIRTCIESFSRSESILSSSYKFI